MPPRPSGKTKGKGGDDSLLTASTSVLQRPPTPNDFQIVATVRSIQNLVNIERKWKYRILEAQRLHQNAAMKRRHLAAMVDKSRDGIRMLDKEIEDLIAGLPTEAFMPKETPAATSGASPAAKKMQSGPPDPSELLPPAPLARRREEAAIVGNIIRAYYNLPRLARETPQHPPRPSTPAQMQNEFEEAVRLSTPSAELMAQAHERALSALCGSTKDKGKRGTGGGQSRKIKGADEIVVDESIADLNPSDFLPLPCPRGIDTKLFQRVLNLRSRRLRLESSISLFEKEVVPLQQRSLGVDEMITLSNYSLNAVHPHLNAAIEEEAALQRIRVAEDEEFVARRSASATPMIPAASPAAAARSRGASQKQQQQANDSL